MASAARSRVATEKVRCDLIVEGGVLLTLDEEDRRIPDGSVAISGNRIAAVDSRDEIARRFQPVSTVDARRHLVLPGFVNVHNHTPTVLYRGAIEDVGIAPSYMSGIPKAYALSREESYHLARLGLYELLRFGTTTVADSFHDPEALAEALRDTGLRGFVNGRIQDVEGDSLIKGGTLEHKHELGERRLADCLEFIKRWHGAAEGRIQGLLAPHATNTCSRELLREVRRAGEKLPVRFHIHLSQSKSENDQAHEHYRMTPTELLDDVGLLDERLVAAHCLFVENSDVERIGMADVAVAHVPIGNAKSGFLAPILELERAGAVIAIGSDTVSADVFESMRTAISLARIRSTGHTLNAAHALGWATRNGAAALGIGDEVGTLAPGMKADVIAVNVDSPNLAPLVDLAGILVYSGRGTNVDFVLVDGRFVLRDGQPVRFDGAEVLAQARTVIRRLWTAEGRPPLM